MNQKVMEIGNAIKTMKTRGAGNIARAAAEALKVLAEEKEKNENFPARLEEAKNYLLSTRPTAISLTNAVLYVSEIPEPDEVVKRAEQFIQESHMARERIVEFAYNIIEKNMTILTHCNSSVVVEALSRAKNKGIKVYSTETRPWGQGFITSSALAEAGVDVTLIVDSAARYFMPEVDMAFFGSDTVLSDGSIINKIGTSQIALAANEHAVPVYILAETFKFSKLSISGFYPKIEERPVKEIIEPEKLPGVKLKNPVFDITPAKYIHSIITERGLIPPGSVFSMMKDIPYGGSYEV